MCEISYSAVEKETGEFLSLVSDPKYICKKCCMTAVDKKNLCKAKKLKIADDQCKGKSEVA